MKRLYLIRHAKSSWDSPELDDFDRPLNRRGKSDCPKMAARLARRSICPDLIVASPAKRAKKTAKAMAKGTGYDKATIFYDEGLYLGSVSYHLQLLIEFFQKVDTLFLVGHNHTITDLAEYLTGTSLVNMPTCAIVAIEFGGQGGFSSQEGDGRLLFFDFPKNEKQQLS